MKEEIFLRYLFLYSPTSCPLRDMELKDHCIDIDEDFFGSSLLAVLIDILYIRLKREKHLELWLDHKILLNDTI